MSRVHHVFVRDRASGVWAHETAFADRLDAEAERDDYRDKPTTKSARRGVGLVHAPGRAHTADRAVRRGRAMSADPECVACFKPLTAREASQGVLCDACELEEHGGELRSLSVLMTEQDVSTLMAALAAYLDLLDRRGEEIRGAFASDARKSGVHVPDTSDAGVLDLVKRISRQVR